MLGSRFRLWNRKKGRKEKELQELLVEHSDIVLLQHKLERFQGKLE